MRGYEDRKLQSYETRKWFYPSARLHSGALQSFNAERNPKIGLFAVLLWNRIVRKHRFTEESQAMKCRTNQSLPAGQIVVIELRQSPSFLIVAAKTSYETGRSERQNRWPGLSVSSAFSSAVASAVTDASRASQIPGRPRSRSTTPLEAGVATIGRLPASASSSAPGVPSRRDESTKSEACGYSAQWCSV